MKKILLTSAILIASMCFTSCEDDLIASAEDKTAEDKPIEIVIVEDNDSTVNIDVDVTVENTDTVPGKPIGFSVTVTDYQEW